MIVGGYCFKIELIMFCICLKVLVEFSEVVLIVNLRLILVNFVGFKNKKRVLIVELFFLLKLVRMLYILILVLVIE